MTIPRVDEYEENAFRGIFKAEAGLTAQNLDIGFRVLKLDDTNMNDVYYTAGDTTQDLLSGLESTQYECEGDIGEQNIHSFFR